MKKGEKRKKMLLKIGYDMFITRGYENTSVDEIIEKAQIAKGTYYYYFQSKEQMLEEVIDMMIDSETEMAKQIIQTDIPVPQKIIGILASMKPTEAEQPIKNTKCDNITERVKMLLILSDGTFNEGAFSEQDIHVFIDITEKLLGAKNGTMSFIYDLIDKSDMEAVE